MTRWAVIILILNLCCAFTYAQQKGDALINYGVKAGFSSTIYEVHELVVEEIPINEYVSKSQISSFYTLFLRTNFKRHYVQTEVSYNISNYDLEFRSDQWNSSAQPHDLSTIGTKIIGLEVPLYYGYHVFKEGPYGMSFYIGPKAKFVLTGISNHTFNNFPYPHIEESIHPVNFSLMAGLGINISRVFFDFSLEYGLHNISKGFTTIDLEGNQSTHDLLFNRRKNVLSFSVGFMF